MDPSESVKYIYSALCILTLLQITKRNTPDATSMVMSPAELSLLYAMKRAGPKQGQEGGCNWSTLGDRLTGKLSPGCLADTGQPH